MIWVTLFHIIFKRNHKQYFQPKSKKFIDDTKNEESLVINHLEEDYRVE